MKERLRTHRKPPGFAIVTPAPTPERPPTAGRASSTQAGQEAIAKPERREEICVWCINRHREACVQCRIEGAYGHMEPDHLRVGEPGPELPPYRELRQWPAEARLAMLYIVIYYAKLEV